jgi:DNA-binding response OmpR family regulator
MSEHTNVSAKILVVDDEPNVLRMVSYTLQIEGYEVIVAQNGVEALSKAQTEVPDLVILDVMMPDMSGIAVCEQLRKTPETMDLPIIMFSALSQVSDKVKCLEAGADEYITKPIAPEELVARVKALLGRYRQIRHPKPLGKVLGFMGAKGGVGTTTVVINLASALAMQEKKVIAAEIRPCYGTFSTQLNLVHPKGLVNLLELDPSKIDEREVSLNLTALPWGLRLLVGPQHVAESREIEPQHLERIIKVIASMADYVILDLPYFPSSGNQAAVRSCDLVAIILEPLSSAMVSGSIAVEQLRSWGVQGRCLGVIVVNRAPYATPIKLDHIGAQLGTEVIAVIPAASDVFISAQQAGLPIVVYRPASDAARAFIEMTKKISSVEGWMKEFY